MAFRGEPIRLDLGEYGMTSAKNLARMPKNSFVLLRNTSVRTGILTRCGGSIKYNATPITDTPDLTGIFDWWPTATVQRMIAYADLGALGQSGMATLYRDAGTTTFPVAMKTGLDGGHVPVFCEGGGEQQGNNNKLFLANGHDPVQVIDGDAVVTRDLGSIGFDAGTMTYTAVTGTFLQGDVINGSTSLSTATVASVVTVAEGVPAEVTLTLVTGAFLPGETFQGSPSLAIGTVGTYTKTGSSPSQPFDWQGSNQPTCLAIHSNRLIGLLGHNLYGSTATDHENFQSVGSFYMSVYPGKSLELLCGVSFASRFYMWKFPTGIYWMDDASTRITDWAIYELTDVVGIAGPNAACLLDNDVLWVSNIGHVHILSPIQQLGDVDASDISMQQNFHFWLEDHVDTTPEGLRGVRAVYSPTLKEAHITYRKKYSKTHAIRVIVDFNRPQVPRFRFEDKDTCESLETYQDPAGNQRLMSGDATGTVWLLNDPSLAVDGAAITSEFVLPDNDGGAEMANIEKNFHWMEIGCEPKGGWLLSVDIVIDGKTTQTVTFSVGLESQQINSIILDTGLLGGNTFSRKRRRIQGSGRTFALRGTLTGAGQDFAISDITIGVTPGSTRFQP